MQINRIGSQNSFGMDIVAKESFWADISFQIWDKPSKKSKKLLNNIEKIQQYPLKDTYEIQEGYKLINKTKGNTVLNQLSKHSEKFSYEAKQADFISFIAKNLKKLAKLEKMK